MCAIAGIFSYLGGPIDPDRLRAMTDAMVHRGPDDEGFYLGPGIGLGMRRLAIIDLATGQQPIANEDGTVQVVANGEIYNFRELRRGLEARGHRFATGSDCEVIVHLYEEHGSGAVERLRGMFALALWDEPRRTLLLARDRVGIKPLYFARRGDGLLFASELKAILASGEVPAAFDWTALTHLFAYLTTPAGESIVAGVEKLRPGHLLLASPAAGVTVRRYWDLAFEPDYGPSEGQWAETLREALSESVGLHRVSDVPLGAFLSGGIDSTAVVAALARSGGEPVRTFSVGFREAEFNELPYARMAARTYGCRHRQAILEPEAVEVLEDLAWYLDEPFGDCSAIPTYMVSQLAASEVTVVLSGDGGDELFAGYDRYLVERRERASRFLPAFLRRAVGALGASLPEGATGRELLRHLGLCGADRYLDSGTLFKEDQRRRLFRAEVRERAAGYDPGAEARRCLASDGHWLSALQRLDFETYLPLDILTKVDRMSMAHSLEARVPLLDHPLIELAARIPPALKVRRGRTKHVFKLALEGWVPEAILERPKRGFAIPLGRWFRGRLGELVRELLLSERSRARGIFEAAYVEGLLARHEAGRRLDLELWTLISFELWCRTFLDRAGEVSRARPALRARPERAPLGPRAAGPSRPKEASVGGR